MSTDVDIYIDEVKEQNDENIVSTMVEGIKNASYDVETVDGFENYGGCTRLNVRTHNHPLAPRLHVHLDIVTRNSSNGPVFPDFTCNQLSINTKGELQLFDVSSMPRTLWWKVQHSDTFVKSAHNDDSYSWDCFREIDDHFFMIRDLRAQVERKEGHVLMYKFTSWSECRNDNNVSSTRSEYLKYVSKLVCYRLPKLLDENWNVLGFTCDLVPNGFRCKKKHITMFREMEFGFEGDMVEHADEPRELADSPSFYCFGCETWHDVVVAFVD